MWTDILVYAIVALVAGLVGWRAFRLFSGRSRGCEGCSGSGCCGGAEQTTGGEPLRPLPGCGCPR